MKFQIACANEMNEWVEAYFEQLVMPTVPDDLPSGLTVTIPKRPYVAKPSVIDNEMIDFYDKCHRYCFSVNIAKYPAGEVDGEDFADTVIEDRDRYYMLYNNEYLWMQIPRWL